MNANPKFLSATAVVDEAAIKPLPNSRKVHVGGSRADISVPMREVHQADTPSMFGGERNPPVFVYDCSGPYTDPAANIDIRSGLAPLRRPFFQPVGLPLQFLRCPQSRLPDDRITGSFGKFPIPMG